MLSRADVLALPLSYPAQQSQGDGAGAVLEGPSDDFFCDARFFFHVQAMKALGQPMDFAAAKEVFSSWDTDESACIEEDEFVIAYCRNF